MKGHHSLGDLLIHTYKIMPSCAGNPCSQHLTTFSRWVKTTLGRALAFREVQWSLMQIINGHSKSHQEIKSKSPPTPMDLTSQRS